MYIDIRKISVGVNFPNQAMHFQVGSEVGFKGIKYKIHRIVKVERAYDIYISDGDISLLWKSVLDSMPVVVEYNIDFE